MRRLIIALLSLFLGMIAAVGEDDYAYYAGLIDNIDSVAELERYSALQLWILEESDPKFFITAATAGRNTFVWYLWKEYQQSSNIKRLETAKIINNLSN